MRAASAGSLSHSANLRARSRLHPRQRLLRARLRVEIGVQAGPRTYRQWLRCCHACGVARSLLSLGSKKRHTTMVPARPGKECMPYQYLTVTTSLPLCPMALSLLSPAHALFVRSALHYSRCNALQRRRQEARRGTASERRREPVADSEVSQPHYPAFEGNMG